MEVGEFVARRQAAEAAMRRLGLKVDDDHMSGDGLTGGGSVARDIKGKGKAVDVVEPVNMDKRERGHQSKGVTEESLEDPPRVVPYLSNVLPPPHPQPPFRLSRTENERRKEWVNGQEHGQDTRVALGDRLRALREVDEVVWGLVGDLTRMKSRWEVEDLEAGGGASESRRERPGEVIGAKGKGQGPGGADEDADGHGDVGGRYEDVSMA